MRRVVFDKLGDWQLGRSTQSANTAIVLVVPPWRAPHVGSGPLMYFLAGGNQPNWLASPRTVLTTLLYTTGVTAHTVTFLRPLNYCRVTAAVAANGTVVNIDRDPGVYSTNYRYPSPLSTFTAAVADNAIAGSDLVAVQLKDGT